MTDIDVRTANNKDQINWNKTVLNGVNGTVFHTWEWSKVVEDGFGDTPIRFIAEVDGEASGVFPLFMRSNLKYSRNVSKIEIAQRMFQTAWSPHPQAWGYGGPCLRNINEGETSAALFSHLNTFVTRKKNILGYRIFPYDQNFFQERIFDTSYKKVVWNTSYVDLEADVWNDMKKGNRTSIRKAQKEGVTIRDAVESDIDGIYDSIWSHLISKITEKNSRHLVYSPKYVPKSYFYALLKHLVPKRMAKICIAQHQGKDIAFAVFTKHNGVVTYLHGASLSEELHLYPNNLLIWHAIEDGKKSQCKTMDLAGLPGNKSDGVYKFKASWNGHEKEVNWYYKEVHWKRLATMKKKIFH